MLPWVDAPVGIATAARRDQSPRSAGRWAAPANKADEEKEGCCRCSKRDTAGDDGRIGIAEVFPSPSRRGGESRGKLLWGRTTPLSPGGNGHDRDRHADVSSGCGPRAAGGNQPGASVGLADSDRPSSRPGAAAGEFQPEAVGERTARGALPKIGSQLHLQFADAVNAKSDAAPLVDPLQKRRLFGPGLFPGPLHFDGQ